jgi:hypothetical protein
MSEPITSNAKHILEDLLPYSILKYEQLLEAYKYLDLIDVKNKNDEKEKIYLKLK